MKSTLTTLALALTVCAAQAGTFDAWTLTGNAQLLDNGDTLRLADEIGFASAFSFKYSKRPGTPGAELGDQVAEEAKKDRLARLQHLLDGQSVAFKDASVGMKTEVLFEKAGRHAGQIAGRTPHLQSVQVDGSVDLIGKTATVEITRRGPHSLFGALETSRGEEMPV